MSIDEETNYISLNVQLYGTRMPRNRTKAEVKRALILLFDMTHTFDVEVEIEETA